MEEREQVDRATASGSLTPDSGDKTLVNHSWKRTSGFEGKEEASSGSKAGAEYWLCERTEVLAGALERFMLAVRVMAGRKSWRSIQSGRFG